MCVTALPRRRGHVHLRRCSVAVFEAGIPRCPPPQGAAARSAAPRWPPTARPHEHLRHTPWPGTRAARERAALSPGALGALQRGTQSRGRGWPRRRQRLLPLVGFQHRLVGQIRRCVPHAMPSARDKIPEVCARLPLEGVESHVGARGLEAARSRRRRGMARHARPPHRQPAHRPVHAPAARRFSRHVAGERAGEKRQRPYPPLGRCQPPLGAAVVAQRRAEGGVGGVHDDGQWGGAGRRGLGARARAARQQSEDAPLTR